MEKYLTSWTEVINIIKMNKPLKITDRFNALPIKIPYNIFLRSRKHNININMETEETMNS